MKKECIIKLSSLAIILFWGLTASSQDCSGVSAKKDKQKLVETFSGITSSDEFYSLLISKEIGRGEKEMPVNYKLFLNVASRVLFPDNVLQTTGTLEFIFSDSTIFPKTLTRLTIYDFMS